MQPLEPLELSEQRRVNPNRIGIFADKLLAMLQSLEEDPAVQKVLGVPVTRSLVVVADENDLRIEAAIDLEAPEAKVFLQALDDVVRENSV